MVTEFSNVNEHNWRTREQSQVTYESFDPHLLLFLAQANCQLKM